MVIKSLLVGSLMAVSLSAELVNLKEGWNLVGLSNSIKIDTLKAENPNIQKVFIYKNEFLESGEIKPADGVWIHSAKDAELYIKDEDLAKDTEFKEEARVDKIELVKGWNLISLPINSAISPKIFKNVSVVWKYQNGKWNKYGGSEDSEYPKIDVIGSGEGFWINSNEAQTIYLSDEEAKLTNFNSDSEMNEYLSAMVNYNHSYRNTQNNYLPYYTSTSGGVAMPTAVPAAPEVVASNSSSSGDLGSGGIKVDDATTTNLQEEGVDEADIVKNDNEKIFYLPSTPIYSSYSVNEIYVNTFERILAGQKEKLTSIKVNQRPNELYLIDNKLIAIYPNNYNFWGYWKSIDYGIWSESSKIEVYDVRDLANITKINEYKIDGNIVDSRVTNNKLYLVTRFMPYVEVEYPKTYLDCGNNSISDSSSSGGGVLIKPESNTPKPYNDQCYFYPKDENGSAYILDYNNPILKTEHLKPTILNTENNSSREIPTAQTLYAPAKFNQASFITSITSFDINDTTKQESMSVVGGSSTIYASNKAIYVTSEEYPIYFGWGSYQNRTSIYKFSIENAISYNGKTFIDGNILNQFSLSEHNNILRVASTTGWNWRSDTDNIVSTIKEESANLSVLGKLSGLGKEGETIRGVRFLGNRGFVVTFRQTDPLYTIDLSDPINPKKVGELSINGYSSYFHPIDENRILSIGRDADENGNTKGVQIQLFNISDFANPSLADKITIGQDWSTNSEAVDNHKAFTYRDGDKLFGFPISEYYERNSTIINGEVYYPEYRWAYRNYFDMYQVNGMKIDKIDKVDGNASSYDVYNNQRGIIFTNNNKDYGLYIAGGEMYVKEIIKK